MRRASDPRNCRNYLNEKKFEVGWGKKGNQGELRRKEGLKNGKTLGASASSLDVLAVDQLL